MTDLLDLGELVDLARFTGLSTTEIAAAKTDFHMSVCRDPIWQCESCASTLKAFRMVIAAVTPLIREEPPGEPVAVEGRQSEDH